MNRGNSFDTPPSLNVATNAHDFNFSADLFADDGSPLSLESATVVATIRADGTTAPLATAFTVSTSDNTLAVFAPATVMTTLRPGTYYFTITATFTGGEKIPLIRARLPVVQG